MQQKSFTGTSGDFPFSHLHPSILMNMLEQRFPLGHIYMLHRCCESTPGRLPANENMNVSPALLEEFIASLKRKGMDIIPLRDVPERLRSGGRKKFAVFTMDDGYKDNLTDALPVFRRQNVPYTIFLAASFPERTAVLWWYVLEDLILENEEIILANGRGYSCGSMKQKQASFLAIREEILRLDQLSLETELGSLFASYNVDWLSKCEQLCLSWDDVRLLSREPLVSFGAHTANHYNLKQLPDEEMVRAEIDDGMRLLEQNAGLVPEVFAYPFGSRNEVSRREIGVLSRMPFSLAVLAVGGSVTRSSKKNMYALPRIFLTEKFIKARLR